jgi:hypothetical protein
VSRPHAGQTNPPLSFLAPQKKHASDMPCVLGGDVEHKCCGGAAAFGIVDFHADEVLSWWDLRGRNFDARQLSVRSHSRGQVDVRRLYVGQGNTLFSVSRAATEPTRKDKQKKKMNRAHQQHLGQQQKLNTLSLYLYHWGNLQTISPSGSARLGGVLHRKLEVLAVYI